MMNGQWFPNGAEAVEFLEERTAEAERRREEPRQKFVDDHQLIHDRRKNEPCIPILPGHDQEACFAKLDSKKIWKKVFEFITSPADMTSAYFSCDMFRKYVEEKRKMAMLAKAFGVLRDTGRLQYSGFGRDVSAKKKEQSREILNLRLVSKTWKKWAEQVYLDPSQPICHSDSWDWTTPMVRQFNNIKKQAENAIEKLEKAGSSDSLIRLVKAELDQCKFSLRKIESMNLPLSEIPNDAAGFRDLVKARVEERKTKTEEKRVQTLKILEHERLRIEREARGNMFGLPDLVWSMELLPLLDDRRDVGSMWDVHPKFRELSGTSLTNECQLTQFLQIGKLPHLWESDAVWMSRLIEFRNISRSMRTSIDGILDDRFMKTLRGGRRFDADAEIIVYDRSFGDLERALAVFCEGSDANRAEQILDHSLSLFWTLKESARDESYFSELERKVRLLLERIGDQVWKFRFDVRCREIFAEAVYHHFLLWLSYMPNLKWIELEAQIDGKIDPNFIQDNPVPRLKYLERVTLKVFNPVQAQCALASAIIGPNRETIRVLELSELFLAHDDVDVLPLLTEMMPLISTLKLDMFMVRGLKWTPSTLEVLKPVASTQWMLTKVWMWKFPMSFQSLFNVLNSISTLKQVNLWVKNVVVGDAVPPLRLQNLVDFELWFDISSVNYNKVEDILFFTSLLFLVHSKKLKTLKWEFSAYELESVTSVRQFKDFMDETGEEELINFKCGYEKDLSRSNLWQVFPELEFIKTVVARNDGKRGGVAREIRKPRPLMM